MIQRKMSSMLKWIAAVVVALGVVCCIWNMSEFNDRNLGLMIGIGFLIGGLQILVFGAVAPLLQRQPEEQPIRQAVRE